MPRILKTCVHVPLAASRYPATRHQYSPLPPSRKPHAKKQNLHSPHTFSTPSLRWSIIFCHCAHLTLYITKRTLGGSAAGCSWLVRRGLSGLELRGIIASAPPKHTPCRAGLGGYKVNREGCRVGMETESDAGDAERPACVVFEVLVRSGY